MSNKGFVQIDLRLPASVKKKGKWYISYCPPLDVVTQGRTQKEALDNLAEAVSLFIETCYERGTLEQILKECGFRRAQDRDIKHAPHERMIKVPFPLIAKQRASAHAC